jgi:uncharacterized iron-regulated membrane protein
LHNGEALGQAGRVIVAVIGLAPATLAITGIVRWRQKVRAREKTKNQAKARVGAQEKAPSIAKET